MSVDYYALPERNRDIAIGNETNPSIHLDIPSVVMAIMKDCSGFERFEMDYAAIAEFEGTTIAKARERWNHTELNWQAPNDCGYVQVIVTNSRVIMHSGGGDSCLEMLTKVFAASSQTKRRERSFLMDL